MYMNFFQKNKLVIAYFLIIGFFSIILLIFVFDAVKSRSRPTPTNSFSSQQFTPVVATNNPVTSTPRPLDNQARGTPLTTAISTSLPLSETPTELGPQGTNPSPPTLQSLATEVPPGTDAPPPPTLQSLATDAFPGTNAPPPPTIQTPTPETPPPGNGPPPGS